MASRASFLIHPRLRAPVGLTDVRAEAVRAQFEHQRATVAAFVGDDLVGKTDRLSVGTGHLIELLDGFGQRLGQRRRVALIGTLNCHRYDRPCAEIQP